ncbi:hypothetical protein B0H13DRAFT_2658986 [Mycena leptocephala]|nr:hypothetical protein B0H13DRAFT_2658986 [Mycena leptocephala]
MNSAEDCMLPVELERAGFLPLPGNHVGAGAGCTTRQNPVINFSSRCSLGPVSHSVSPWIKPLLYKTISVDQRGTQPAFSCIRLPAVAKMITFLPASLRYYTRNVCFVDLPQEEVVVDFLSRCGATVNIAFINAPASAPALLPIVAALPLEHLSCRLMSSFQLFPFPSAFYGDHSLTHLDILDRLLEVLVFVYGNQTQLDENRAHAELVELVCDSRIVMLVVTNRLADWEMGARGGEDLGGILLRYVYRKEQ